MMSLFSKMLFAPVELDPYMRWMRQSLEEWMRRDYLFWLEEQREKARKNPDLLKNCIRFKLEMEKLHGADHPAWHEKQSPT